MAAHLSWGDVILSVNQCPVRGSRDWLTCLTNMPALPSDVARRRADSAESLLPAKEDLVARAGQPAPYTGTASQPDSCIQCAALGVAP